jgi:multiple sugar transport system ATP-binding protein
MGNEIVAYLKAGNTDFVARVDPRSELKVGDKAQVVFNAANLHLFDKDTEKAIR